VNVTHDESIAIYARATMKWFGANARQRTRRQIDRLRKAGDAEGVEVYQRVYECIAQIEKQRTLPHI